MAVWEQPEGVWIYPLPATLAYASGPVSSSDSLLVMSVEFYVKPLHPSCVCLAERDLEKTHRPTVGGSSRQ